MTLQQVIQLIQATLVPVIMISAEGLVALVIQQRYGRIIDRLRTVNYERIRVREQLNSALHPASAQADLSPLRQQLSNDEMLLNTLLRRARLARNALFAAFLGMSLFVATSFSLIVEAVSPSSSSLTMLPLGFFTAGMIAFLVGFAFILVELFQSLRVSETEVAIVSRQLKSSQGSRT